jgi:outer membrane lipoprotein-sorting protein
MNRIFLIVISLMFGCLGNYAQTAQQVLDATAKILTSSQATRVVFTGTNFSGTQETGNFKGTIVLKGTAYNLDSDMIRAWFDGKTLWTILSGSEEVNVSHPTQEELQTMNPLYFINLYKKGYNLTCEKLNHNGIPSYQVNLLAQDAASPISEMRVVINQATSLPLSIRMRKGKDWFRIRISECETNVKVGEQFFTFDQGLFPNYDLIDLR